MTNIENLKVAINCDWLTDRWWAEKVINDIVKIFPNADIFTSIYNELNFPEFKWKNIKTSYLQKLPNKIRKHTMLLPFYPLAFETFDFSWYDIVITSSHSLSKWIITDTKTLHICYCHTPVRALWSDHKMFENDPRFKYIPNFVMNYILHKLRIYDYLSAQRVDLFLANSNYVSKRIKKFYWKEAKVVYPACDMQVSNDYKKSTGEYFLSISRLVPMKKNDLLVEAFNKMPDKKLKIYWNWSELFRLRSMIRWDNIEILEWEWNKFGKEKEEIMSRAIAFLHPQKEDFWISPLDAQSYWVPVIAFAEWWALETVIDWKTWVFHKTQNVDEIIQIVRDFDENKFDRKTMIENVNRFSSEKFKENFIQIINNFIRNW